ncbi:hypothetical protein [Exiguobacterium sp. s166]|uniref:hypothetical protein n=1 Tax=Exiguobacterium sp. s166 TaxID=2751204 RepID=UPI001BE53800|nr:hypothetical protein [Exiguobacterium sp. s166]
MEKLEIRFVNGDVITIEEGTNLNEVRNTIQNHEGKFITLNNGVGVERTICIDKIVQMVLS